VAGRRSHAGHHRISHHRGRYGAAGLSARGRRADKGLASRSGGLTSCGTSLGTSPCASPGASLGTLGGRGSGHASTSSSSLSGIGGGASYHGLIGKGLHLPRVVGLATLHDLESVWLAAGDLVVRGPGEFAILGVSGDGLDILEVAGITLAQANSDGLSTVG
jgi:hypothetical protein